MDIKYISMYRNCICSHVCIRGGVCVCGGGGGVIGCVCESGVCVGLVYQIACETPEFV